jgi:hypothetical protein
MPDQSDIAVKNIFADITDDMMAYFLRAGGSLLPEFTHEPEANQLPSRLNSL